jgi:hypothetical protein
MFNALPVRPNPLNPCTICVLFSGGQVLSINIAAEVEIIEIDLRLDIRITGL